jgi:hypothetical protein
MVHLIYLHQGHTALPSYLYGISQVMETLLDGESHIAQANSSPLDTMNGIDDAVNRAVEELCDLLNSRPQITKISLVGVSLGGVILERVAQRMYDCVLYGAYHIDLMYFIAFASPLNGITVGWNLPTLTAKMLGWADPTLTDLLEMHDKQRESVKGISLFKRRICLGNLCGDWRVPLSSAFPVGGKWPWSPGTQRLVQRAIDESVCVWHAVVLDLSNRWRVHHAITDDVRSFNAIRDMIVDPREDNITTL